MNEKSLINIYKILKNQYSSDWLLPLEIYELAIRNDYAFSDQVHEYLINLQDNKSFKKLIQNGLKLIQNH